MIKINNLTKYFGNLCAVNDLTLSIKKGELFCFLGPNGAGKTTTVKMLTGLMSPSSGDIEIGGVNLAKNPVAAKSLMGYIPDMPYLYEHLTAEEFMEFVGDLYRMEKERRDKNTEKYLDLFGLQDYRSRLIKNFSHGMRQRLIYAATFLHEPEVLFIDEPLIALDPYTIKLIKDTLRDMAGSGMAIFVTTHILALAEDIADTVAIIHNGSVIARGSCGQLLEKYSGKGLEEVFLRITAREKVQQP